jgi:hypothetical protein
MASTGIKKKHIKFCPSCGSSITPPVKVKRLEPKTPANFAIWSHHGLFSICSNCGFEFTVQKKTNHLDVAKPCGSAHRQECGAVGGSRKGKIAHSSVAEAYARCLTLVDVPGRYRATMQFYLCRWCGKIHMGHGGKGRKNVTVAYTHEEAKVLYEQAIQNGELMPQEEIMQNK